MKEVIESEGMQFKHSRFLQRLRARTRRLLKVGTASAVPVGGVRWGGLRRTSPVSRVHGYDRGKPVDRHYIEQFLSIHSKDISGHVLEIKDPGYTKKFGRGVTRSDVLDIDSTNPQATIVADLNSAVELPGGTFDCIIFTQTLQYIYQRDLAIRELHRSLRPGGVLLMTVPGVTLAAKHEPWHWAFTPVAVARILGEHFDLGQTQILSYGNLLTATSFLYGLCAEEMRLNELAFNDPEYPIIIGARAMKAP